MQPAWNGGGIEPDEPGLRHCLLSIVDPATFTVLWVVDPRLPDSVQRILSDASGGD